MRVFLPAGLGHLHPVDVNFANWLRLAGVRIDPGPESIHVCLRWRSIRKTYQPWRCFVHLLSGDHRISSLDHPVLGGRPPVDRWEPGDEGFEKLDHWWDRRPENLALHLGLYDPELNVRCPIAASTLPVRDDSSAVVLDLAGAPSSQYAIEFPSPPLIPCGITFRHQLELTAYSAAQVGDLTWLRLKWTLRGHPLDRLRFFGHVVSEPSPSAPTLAQFDQDICTRRRGPATWIEQNVVGPTGSLRGVWLRAGVCTKANLHRLPILGGPQPYDTTASCFYRPLEPQSP